MKISGDVIANKIRINDSEIEDVISIELPEVTNGTYEVKGAGVMGTIDMPSFSKIEGLSLTVEYRSSTENNINLLSPTVHEVKIAFVKDVVGDDGVFSADGNKVFAQVRTKSHKMGTISNGENMSASATFEVLSYKMVDGHGKELINIDKIKYIYRINGVDYAEQTRNYINQM